MLTRGAVVATDLIFPRRCPACDEPVKPFGRLICEACESKLDTVGTQTCRKCGAPLHLDKGDDIEYCRRCLLVRHRYHCGTAVYRYRSASGALYRLKYEGRAEYADFFGRKMAEKFRSDRRFDYVDMIVPVPTSGSRIRQRGYDQAALLAQVMAQETGIPCRTDVLERRADTPVLRNKSALERQAFLKNAFIAHRNDVKLRIIVLVDDIYTTGATIDACAEALFEAGAKDVYFVTAAIGETY